MCRSTRGEAGAGAGDMTEVTPHFKDNVGDCPCGCGAYGTLKRPRADGSRCVARKCPCIRCRNKRNQRRGRSRQAQALRRAGYRGKYTPHHEEQARWWWRWEHKDGKFARTVVTAYKRERAQSEAERPIGDVRPFVASYSVDTKHTYYVIRDDDLADAAVAMLENWDQGGGL